MEDRNISTLLHGADRPISLADLLEPIEEKCKSCKPLTPITCISGCKTWKLKNELRELHKKTKNPAFMTNLLNTLKNKRRLQLLDIISEEPQSITLLQHELRKLGFNHSQQTIVQEYLGPLMTAGLADEHQNLYHATLFGRRINALTKDFNDLADILSPHSECYEEIALDVLMKGSRTYEALRRIIPEKSVARVLSRLQKAALAQTSTDKDYIFFFATKRNPDGSCFIPTEKQVYERIPKEGISARKLATEARISLRATYKYLRKLKGKKLVFARKRPASYSLTAKGLKMCKMLEAIHDLAAEALQTTRHLLDDEGAYNQETVDIEPARKKR
jgi:predicted transcriptional regulator